MQEHREALERILAICNQSDAYTRRTQHIHEVAMTALGLTKSQRDARHARIIERNGGETAKERYLTRKAKREAKEKVTCSETCSKPLSVSWWKRLLLWLRMS